jgi:hypothetical protein
MPPISAAPAIHEHVRQGARVPSVGFDQRVLGMDVVRLPHLPVLGVVVDAHDREVALQQVLHHVAADETSRACHEDLAVSHRETAGPSREADPASWRGRTRSDTSADSAEST